MVATRRSDVPSIEQLGELFASLGYQQTFEPLPIAPHSGDAATVIARHGPFRVVAMLVDHDAPSAAKRCARGLERTADRSLVVAVDRQRGLAALATWRVDTPPVCRVVDLSRPKTVQRLLDHLAARASDSALALHFRAAEALVSEGVGPAFFRAFRRTLDRFARESRLPTPDGRVLALTALTRVLFLYFVQAKGWLNLEPTYLRLRLDRALSTRRSFQTDVLDPLMFRGLNTPPSSRRVVSDLGRIPFLNGGLFERTALERQHRDHPWSNSTWRRAFDELFDRFHFSVSEAGDPDVVEPDMLGQIFEGVMDPRRRLAAGAFYTPHAQDRAPRMAASPS